MGGDGLDSLVGRLNLMRERYVPGLGQKLTAISSRIDVLREKDKPNYVHEACAYIKEVEDILYDPKNDDCDLNPDLVVTFCLRYMTKVLRENFDKLFRESSGNAAEIIAYIRSMVTVGEMYRARMNQLSSQIELFRSDSRPDTSPLL